MNHVQGKHFKIRNSNIACIFYEFHFIFDVNYMNAIHKYSFLWNLNGETENKNGKTNETFYSCSRSFDSHHGFPFSIFLTFIKWKMHYLYCT